MTILENYTRLLSVVGEIPCGSGIESVAEGGCDGNG